MRVYGGVYRSRATLGVKKGKGTKPFPCWLSMPIRIVGLVGGMVQEFIDFIVIL